ncbi:glycosyltransferase [Fibrobacter sp. UBA4297]|uniref:glycosyltransferase family 32 protein n=1 Tax=Fibrobacter sp. UBA4297 TaxID=1946536 RepID=UPI0025BC84A0|nr:glycosyltransferase [Fibrobacter sp. UBA4297]
MIPKKIHYIWLSNDPLPHLAQLCIDSWKRHCPDYEIIHWDMARCQKIIDSIPFVREAVSLSKWAFASDYIRLYAVATEGGIYLDSDVYLYRSFDEFLDNRYFTNIEFTTHFKRNKSWKMLNEDGTKKNRDLIPLPGLAFQAAIFGGEANHPFLKKCMSYYENQKFILPGGKLNIENISPYVYAHTAIDFGFVYKNKMQHLDEGMTIYPSKIFLPSCDDVDYKPVAIHVTSGSWRPLSHRIGRFFRRLPIIIMKMFKKKQTMDDVLNSYESKKPVEF